MARSSPKFEIFTRRGFWIVVGGVFVLVFVVVLILNVRPPG
jgi:hypothetical protein